MKQRTPWIFFLFFLCSLLFSCNHNDKKNMARAPYLNISIPHDPPTMDPRKGGDELSSAFHFMLFEGLTRLMPDGSVTLAQAKSLDISEDKKHYIFHLRDTVWSDGTPVTAYDFEKSWKDILDPKFPSSNAQLLYPIKNADAAKKGIVPMDAVGILATDAKTLHIELVRPTPYFLELISFCIFSPVNHTIDQKDPNWAFQKGKHFTSNGFYTLKKWKHSGEVILIKNPTYWKPSAINLKGIHFHIINQEMTVLQMFEKGELDLIVQYLSPLPTDALPALKAKGMLQTTPLGGSSLCAFNTLIPPFNNKHIRTAFSIAIDRACIVKEITQLNEVPAYGAIPPVLKKNRHRAFFQDGDAKLARHYLALGLKELGMQPEDLDITYIYMTSELEHKIAQALQQQWEINLGIKVKLANVERKILLDKLMSRNYAMAQAAWYAQYNDQINLLERYFDPDNVKNYAHWENQEFKHLIDLSFTATTPQERLDLLEQAEEIFVSDAPISPIYHKNAMTLLKPHVQNVLYTPIGNLCFEQIKLSSSSSPPKEENP